MLRWGSHRFAPIACVFLSALAGAQGVTERTERFDQFSVRPFVELEPGFTAAPRETFTLEMSGIGRRPVEVVAVELNGRKLSASAWSVQLSKLVIIPNADLRVGLNRFVVRYNHPSDPRHAESDNPVAHAFQVNHQPVPVHVALGDQGELIVEGSRRFVRAGYRSGQTDRFAAALPSARAAGFNMVHDYRFENYDLSKGTGEFVEEARAYLRSAQELGLGVFFGLPRSAVRNYDEDRLSEIVAGLSGERALWMWYIYDEPSQATLGVEQASRVYNLMRRLDPNRPSIMLVNRVPEMLVYHPFCDVLWYDRYPIIATTEALSSLSPIAAALQKTRQSVGLRKPVWPVLQVHDNKGSPSLRSRRPGLPAPDDENHRPNEAEIRAQAHLAIALDSMGVVYYWAPQSWYSMESDTPKVWNTLSRVVRELQGLEPVLLSTETPPAVTATGDNKVLLWKRRHDGRIYVGLINTSLHAAQPVTLRMPFKDGSRRVLLGDGRAEFGTKEILIKLPPAGVTVLIAELP